jgi:dissimilatory sulfite reductase (desulfoviridin) alpha/beta subunit
MKRCGTPLPSLYSEEQLFPLITRILNLYKEEGRPGERFASVVERLGMDNIARVLHETV